jgi:hypothetical protein
MKQVIRDWDLRTGSEHKNKKEAKLENLTSKRKKS